jgi:hypothetical protein
MRSVAVSLVLVSALALAGCQSKAEKVKNLLDRYNTEYPAYARDCLEETSGPARMLTGEQLTVEQMVGLEVERKERDARCKPEADRLAQIQREILAAQQ